MTSHSVSQVYPATSSRTALDASIVETPDFHHVPPNNAWALEAYLHLYLDNSSRVESLLKSSVERRAA